MSFSKEQMRAIGHDKGPALVLAGPGSGKTTVITQRILHLTRDCAVDPETVLVITFTKAAAMEMEARFHRLCKEDGTAPGKAVYFGTFHSVFFHILKLNYQFTYKNIITERDQLLLIRELIERENLDIAEDSEYYKNILSEISGVKSEPALKEEAFISQYLEPDSFARVYRGYQKALKQRRLIDFDDMMGMCYRLLLERPEELKLWQARFRYILVDEFQDINRIQYEVVRLLAAPQNNLFIVGDDDQSIYGFRGAKPEIMLGFTRDYPQAVQILLDNNYRSRREIVRFAAAVIAQNKKRFAKEITAVRESGGSVTVQYCEDILRENLSVVQAIQQELSAGIPADEIAVLYRTAAIIRPLLEELNRKQLPYVMKEKVQNLYEHFIAKDMIAYVRLSLGLGTRADFLRVMNKPLRYISREVVSGQTVNFRALLKHYENKPDMRHRTERLLADLNVVRRLNTVAALVYIRKKMGYEAWTDEFACENRIETAVFHDIMDELETAAVAHPDKKEWLAYIDAYSRALLAKPKEEAHGIRLMTYHGAKGLEFHAVHLVDCVEGITPYKKAVSAEALEEERRAFYVACTRAKEILHIYVTKTRYSKACSPSRFVPEGEKNGKQRKFWSKFTGRGADDRHPDTGQR